MFDNKTDVRQMGVKLGKRTLFLKKPRKKIDFLRTRRYTVIAWSKRELLWSKMEWR